MMDAATISANGQITLPAGVRRRLGLVPGDKILFIENERGDTVIVRPSVAALLEAQRAFARVAEDSDPEDVQRLVDDVRYGGRAKRGA